MKIKDGFIGRVVTWIFKSDAITLGSYIFLKNRTYTIALLMHQLVHGDRYKEKGFWYFLVFMYEYLRCGNRPNKYDVSARVIASQYRERAMELYATHRKKREA